MPFTSLQVINKSIQHRTVVLFGAGNIAHKTMRLLPPDSCNLMVDNAENHWGTEEYGIQVRSPEELRKLDNPYVIICTTSFREVSVQLADLGFKNIKDFSISPILNDLRIIDEIESIEKQLIFSSGAPALEDEQYGGGIYKININQKQWFYEKKISGNCYGIIRHNENFVSVETKLGIFEFDKDFNILRNRPLPKGCRGHGVAYSEKHRQFYIACSYKDSIYVLDYEFNLVKEIPLSDKLERLGSPQHHCNDLFVIDDSIYVSMFSYSGNWKKEIYDGVVLEIDIVSAKPRSPVICNLSMPHNITMTGGGLTVLNSLEGTLLNNNCKKIGRFPGFTRGLAWDGVYYYIGQSRNRNFSKNIGLSLNTSIDTSIIVFDETTKVSKSFFLPSEISEIHSIALFD